MFLICNSSFALGNWTHRASVSRLPRFQWGPHPWGLATAHHLVSELVRLSFPPAPPPLDFALSEPLPWGLQGWLQLVSDIATRNCLQRRKVRRRAATWMLRGREAQGGWRQVKTKKRDQDRRVVQETRRRNVWKTQNCSFWRSSLADGNNDLQRGKMHNRASGGAVEALESGDNKQNRW